jgi:hypothetical protein
LLVCQVCQPRGPKPARSKTEFFFRFTLTLAASDIWLGQQSDVFKMLPSNGLAIVRGGGSCGTLVFLSAAAAALTTMAVTMIVSTARRHELPVAVSVTCCAGVLLPRLSRAHAGPRRPKVGAPLPSLTNLKHPLTNTAPHTRHLFPVKSRPFRLTVTLAASKSASAGSVKSRLPTPPSRLPPPPPSPKALPSKTFRSRHSTPAAKRACTRCLSTSSRSRRRRRGRRPRPLQPRL